MPSPFPGMDPYLERDAVFHDFHQRFATAVAAQLSPQIRPRYYAQIDMDIYLHELPGDRQLIGRPDVSVSGQQGQPGTGGRATLEAPAHARIPQAVDVLRLPYVQLFDKASGKVVTAIELLSPTNKGKAEDRAAYLAKRQRLLRSDVHLVEIDLLRGGARMPLEELPPCDYCVMVSRVAERPRVGVWPFGLRDRLPLIPVPLRLPDADAELDLRAALDRVYDEAGYADYLYGGAPQPALEATEAAWAGGVLAKA